MLRPLTDLNLVARQDFTADAWILISGATGTWVAPTATGVGKPTAGDYCRPIFSESNRDGTAGFSPDITATGKVTTLYGKLRALTDKYSGSPALGNKMSVTAAGVLEPQTGDVASTTALVAVCTKTAHSLTHLGTTYTVIEFETL